MKNGRRNLIIACVIVFAGLLIWLYWHRNTETLMPPATNRGDVTTSTSASKKPNAAIPITTPTQAEATQQKEQQLNALYFTPIAVYGKVVDENGNPVVGATVEIGINDSPVRSGSDHMQTTDGEGLFSLTGVHGIAFSLRASKDGYYTTAESRGQRNVIVPSNDDVLQPSKGRPVVLILRKKGETMPLFFVSSRQIDVPRTGQPMTVDLATGRTGQGDLYISSWLGDSAQPRFDWRYQVSVPGGGLIERKGPFDFEAPADGYQATLEINMPISVESWCSDVTKNYFAKLPNGRYARLSINFYPGQRNFVVLESYVNPAVGNRNLEFDRTKVVKSP